MTFHFLWPNPRRRKENTQHNSERSELTFLSFPYPPRCRKHGAERSGAERRHTSCGGQMFPSCCYSTLREKEKKGGSARDWRRPRPIEAARRNAEANWKQPPTGKEGGMCLSPRRRLTPGNSEKAEKKNTHTKRTGFLEESGAERESARTGSWVM